MRNIESRIWVSALSLHGELFNRLNRILTREFGLTLAKYDVLAQLVRLPEGMTLGELSRDLKVTGGNVTGLVRRLNAEGMLTREVSPVDRRSFTVRITPHGASLHDATRQRHDALLGEWLGNLPAEELDQALRSLSLLNRHIGSARSERTGGREVEQSA
ncbi:MAG: MarR family transcriptional regulator [Sphingobium sp.]